MAGIRPRLGSRYADFEGIVGKRASAREKEVSLRHTVAEGVHSTLMEMLL